MYYIFAVIQVYFISEWIKQSGWAFIRPPSWEIHFNNCIRKHQHDFDTNHLYKMCDVLNNREDFTQFVNNIIHCVTFIYVLTRHVISDYTVVDLSYWSVVTLSTIGYSFLNNNAIFQFSFQQTSTFTHSQVILCITVSCLMILLVGYQLYMKRIKYNIFILPTSVYIMTYLLFRSITSNVSWHIHHVITFGVLSLCFTDFQYIMNRFMHAIMIGGVIQGINIYGIQEIFLFSIDYNTKPSFVYLSWLCVGYFVCWNIIRKRNSIIHCNKKDAVSMDENHYVLLNHC